MITSRDLIMFLIGFDACPIVILIGAGLGSAAYELGRRWAKRKGAKNE